MMFWLLLLLLMMQDPSPDVENPDVPDVKAIGDMSATDATLPSENQTEYPIAWTLTAAMLLLGMLAVCIPRFRKQHFVEPPESAGRKSPKRR